MKDYNAATYWQNFVASVCGATASLVVSAPLDVIKTRIQNRYVLFNDRKTHEINTLAATSTTRKAA